MEQEPACWLLGESDTRMVLGSTSARIGVGARNTDRVVWIMSSYTIERIAAPQEEAAKS